MSDPPEDETPNDINIEFEAMLNRIVANRRTRRRTLLGAVASDEMMRAIQESQHTSIPYLNIPVRDLLICTLSGEPVVHVVQLLHI